LIFHIFAIIYAVICRHVVSLMPLFLPLLGYICHAAVFHMLPLAATPYAMFSYALRDTR